jgi:hypothetical protein
MRVRLVLAATLAGLIASALLIFAAEAADPAKPYLGMSKEAILACAGAPYAKYKSGADAETLTYHYSGAGPVPTPPGEKKKKEGGLAELFPGGDKEKKDKTEQKDKKDKEGDAADASGTSEASQPRVKGSGKKGKKKDGGWTCTASLTFESGRLARVNFAHKDARSPYEWQSEKNPKKQAKMRDEPPPTCTFSLPNCHPAQ